MSFAFAARRSFAAQRDQRSLMDAIYAAGSLPIAADDRTTKVMATRLTIFGFVVIELRSRRMAAPGASAPRRRSALRWIILAVAKPTSRYAVGDCIPESDAVQASPG